MLFLYIELLDAIKSRQKEMLWVASGRRDWLFGIINNHSFAAEFVKKKKNKIKRGYSLARVGLNVFFSLSIHLKKGDK